MCQDRILCRLRLRPNSRHSPKRALAAVFQEAISSVKHLCQVQKSSWHLYSSAQLFVERGRAVLQLLNSWTRHQTTTELAQLVTGVHHLLQVNELGLLLDAVPVLLMKPQSRKSILNIIRKVARYRDAARFLYRIAKKYPIVQNMNTVIIDPPQAAFGNGPTNTDISTLQAALYKIGGTSYDLEYVCKLLRIDQAKASGRYIEQTQQTLKSAKMHAEIQLIFHMEQSSAKHPPRVVCSSKDACFLCNLFIAMHGKIHTPRCHGKLYPGWRLPITPLFIVLQRHFNARLQAHVRSSLATLLSRRQKTSYPDPNESTLLTLPSLVSTIHTVESTLVSHDGHGANLSCALLYEEQLPQKKKSSNSSCSVPCPGKRANWNNKHSTDHPIVHLEQTEDPIELELVTLKVHNKTYKPYPSTCCGREGVDRVSDSVAGSPIRITGQDLPFCQRVTKYAPTVELNLDTVALFFEFVTVHDGRLSIFAANLETENGAAKIIDVTDIPTHSELKVKCSKGSIRLFVLASLNLTIRLEFVWASDCSCPKTTTGCIYQNVQDDRITLL